MFAEVVVELPIPKKFDYFVPPNMESSIEIGMRAWVPFGSRRLPGYIVGIKDLCEYKDVRPLIKFIDKNSLLSPFLITLAEWISEYYYCTLGNVFKSMIPSRVRQITPKRDELKYVRVIGDKVDLQELGRKAPKQAEVMQILYSQSNAIKLVELAEMANTNSGTIESLHKKGLIEIITGKIDRDPYKSESFQQTFPHILNEEQRNAYNIIKEMTAGTILLQGVTGSGKTEIYIQTISDMLNKGKGAIVIVPEISLTPQTVERFKSRFSNENVAVLHSRLSFGERYDQWQKIREGKARIVIGARSAIFAPVKNLGLIVVDEEHEKTYKQEDDPRYHARDVAVKRGEIENAVVILGSATPSIESYYLAEKGVYKLVKLTKRIDDRPLATVKIVSLKDEIKKFRRFFTFSPPLLNKIKDRLLKKEQVILFLNRRGSSPFVLCRHCGFVIRCQHCTTALTYHQLGDKLICHTCGYSAAHPAKCPECKDPNIRYGGVGTQKVESQIAKLFPMANIRRMDTDVTAVKGIHKKILDDFKDKKIDILVGTQMIAKGLDFPNVTLVGVVSADIALHLPDFRAGEHTFQILTQVAGRAGRGDVPGEVIIQTFTPEHPGIKAAITQDYDSFVKAEMAIRKELDYPPYEHFINIVFRSRNSQKAELVARQCQKNIEGKTENTIKADAEQDEIKITEGDLFYKMDIAPVVPQKQNPANRVKVFGAIPAPVSLLRGYYRWQLLLKAPTVEEMLPLLKKIEKHEGVIMTIDVDPIYIL
jgi:primosomal protein N' (replication factor Y)